MAPLAFFIERTQGVNTQSAYAQHHPRLSFYVKLTTPGTLQHMTCVKKKVTKY